MAPHHLAAVRVLLGPVVPPVVELPPSGVVVVRDLRFGRRGGQAGKAAAEGEEEGRAAGIANHGWMWALDGDGDGGSSVRLRVYRLLLCMHGTDT